MNGVLLRVRETLNPEPSLHPFAVLLPLLGVEDPSALRAKWRPTSVQFCTCCCWWQVYVAMCALFGAHPCCLGAQWCAVLSSPEPAVHDTLVAPVAVQDQTFEQSYRSQQSTPVNAAHMLSCGPEYAVPGQASDLDSLITYFRAGVARKPPDILWREWSVDDDRPQVWNHTQHEA